MRNHRDRPPRHAPREKNAVREGVDDEGIGRMERAERQETRSDVRVAERDVHPAGHGGVGRPDLEVGHVKECAQQGDPERGREKRDPCSPVIAPRHREVGHQQSDERIERDVQQRAGRARSAGPQPADQRRRYIGQEQVNAQVAGDSEAAPPGEHEVEEGRRNDDEDKAAELLPEEQRREFEGQAQNHGRQPVCGDKLRRTRRHRSRAFVQKLHPSHSERLPA